MLTDGDIRAGEDVRWLPRRNASDLLLPGTDLWMFDQRLVRFHHNAGDGSLEQYESVSDPRRVIQVVAAFEMVWERAIPHQDYRLPNPRSEGANRVKDLSWLTGRGQWS